MHIALIISSLETGGAERVVSELANAWVSRGHHLSLITLSGGLKGAHKTPFYPLHPKVRLLQLDQSSNEEVSLFTRFCNIIHRILKIRKTVKLINPDIIVSFIDVLNVTTLIATRTLKIPVIVSERTHPLYHQLPGLYRYLRNITYPWASKVVTQTKDADHYFSNISSSKRAVIPNSVKKPKRQKAEKDTVKPVRKIISVGRLCPYKGFSALISAFSEISRIYPEMTLTIYGEGAERNALEALIHELNLAHVATLPGTVQNIDEKLYEADLFVFPSHYEGFPNALCEAMATGLPVIASNCSGNIDIVRDGVDGRLFGVDDVPQLSRLLQEIIEDAPQRVALSQGALTLPDRFDNESILKKWDEVLQAGVRQFKS